MYTTPDILTSFTVPKLNGLFAMDRGKHLNQVIPINGQILTLYTVQMQTAVNTRVQPLVKYG